MILCEHYLVCFYYCIEMEEFLVMKCIKEIITALWYDLITNIRAQYEELVGSSNTMEAARLSF